MREAVPALRILDEELWTRVKQRKADLSAQRPALARKPKRLLSAQVDRNGAQSHSVEARQRPRHAVLSG